MKITNARSNNISSFSKSCLLIHIYAGYSMKNKTESICITLHWCSLTSSIAHKYSSLWTAGKELLQSACMLLSKVYFQEAYDSVDYKWTFLIPTHIAKLYFVHYKLYLRSPISINLHKKDVITSVIFYKVSYFKINIIFAFVTSNSLIHHVVTKTQG